MGYQTLKLWFGSSGRLHTWSISFRWARKPRVSGNESKFWILFHITALSQIYFTKLVLSGPAQVVPSGLIRAGDPKLVLSICRSAELVIVWKSVPFYFLLDSPNQKLYTHITVIHSKLQREVISASLWWAVGWIIILYHHHHKNISAPAGRDSNSVLMIDEH